MTGGVPAGRLSIEIVAEIARLQSDLDKAKRVVNAASKDIEKSVGAANDNFGRMTKMSGNAAFAMRNLGFQVQDAITQLSLGQSPMKVFAAQGFQIADALSQIKREAAASGQSVSSMLVGSFGKAGPAILAAAVALGAVATALKIVQDDLNETGNASLSYSDVALGAFDAVRAFTVDKLGPAFEWLANVAGTVWGYIAAEAKRQANFMIGVMVAVPSTIYAAFTTLPAAVAELFVNMANGAIKAIEGLVNKAVAGLNSFAGMVNGLLGTSIGGVGTVSFGRIENTFAGAGSRAGLAMGKALTSSFGDYVGKAEAYIRPFAEARARMGDAAEKAGKAAGARGGKAGGGAAGEAMADEWAKTLADIAKDTSESMAGLNKELHETVDAILKIGEADLDEALKEIGIKGELYVAKLNDELAITLERVDALIGSLGNMGGLGGLLGDIGSVLTSKNPIASMLGMGGVGTILGSVLGGQDVTDKMGTAFTKSIMDTFPGLNEELAGKIGGTLSEFLTGASIGGAVGGTFFGGSASAQTGSMIGGMLGKAAFKELASEGLKKALGAFGGPLGSIAGALLGGVLGKMLGGTPRGGATIGAGGVSGTWGNSSQRIGAATSMGNSAVDALSQLASALGVNLGSFSSSVSVRKNDLRFDPTGSGISKTSKGAISFGQDEEALLKAVIKDAISDGAFAGLSEGFKNYLTSGDVEARLQDVLNLKGVMNEAAQMRDPQGFALGELDKWRTSMLAIATATGEGMADIEFVYGKKREEILAAANDNIVDLTRDRTALLIQIAELEGRSAEALAMARELERSAADESLRPLYDRIYALQDVAQAEAEAAQAAAAAEQAERELADARKQASQIARSFYEKQRGLEIDILRLQGKETDALRLQRELELFAMDASLRPLLMRKYALEDEAAAAAAAATEAARLAAEQEALAEAQRRAADEAAARQKAITDEIGGLNRQWLELTGQTAKIREMDLAALLSDEARGIQQRIWDYNDALAAQAEAEKAAQQAVEDYTRRLEDARNALSAAYERESSALQGTIDKFRDFAASIRDFRMGLSDGNPATTLTRASSRFANTARMAAFGNESSLQSFNGDAQAYLDAARNQAGSFGEYQDAIIRVTGAARRAEGGALGVAGQAAQQLGAMQAAVSKLIDLEKGQIGVWEAVKNLEAVQREEVTPVIVDAFTVGQEGIKAELKQTREEAKALSLEGKAANEQTVILLNRIERILSNASRGDALAVTNDNGDPIYTTAAT